MGLHLHFFIRLYDLHRKISTAARIRHVVTFFTYGNLPNVFRLHDASPFDAIFYVPFVSVRKPKVALSIMTVASVMHRTACKVKPQ
jgi:hypothetical protein